MNTWPCVSQVPQCFHGANTMWCLPQALGPDRKSALVCDFFMENHTSGTESAMCGIRSRVIFWTEIMRHKPRCRFFEFDLQHLCLDTWSQSEGTLSQANLKSILPKSLSITEAWSIFQHCFFLLFYWLLLKSKTAHYCQNKDGKRGTDVRAGYLTWS